MTELVNLPVDQLRRPEYQAERFNQDWAGRIAQAWSDDLAGVITVNERDGVYWVIDGNHRVAAALIRGAPGTLRCEVHRGLRPDEEPDHFFRLDAGRRKITRFEKFAARLYVGRADEVEMNKIAEEHGFTISRRGNEGAISAVSVIEGIYGTVGWRGYRSPGPALLRRTLRLAYAIYGGDGRDGRFLGGLAAVLDKHPDLDEETLVRRLMGFGPLIKLLGEAKGMYSGGSVNHQMGNAIIRQYNYKKTTHRLSYFDV